MCTCTCRSVVVGGEAGRVWWTLLWCAMDLAVGLQNLRSIQVISKKEGERAFSKSTYEKVHGGSMMKMGRHSRTRQEMGRGWGDVS